MDKATIAIYDESAEYYSTARQIDSDRAGRFRTMVGPGLIVDLGCGTGRFLGELGTPTVGLDASIGMLAFARRGSPGRVLQADLEAIPLAGGSVAGIFASYCLQHLPRPNVPAVLLDIRRALRPGGAFEIAVQAGEYEGRHRPGDDLPGRWFSFWTLDALTAVIEDARFEVVDTVELPRHVRVVAVRR